MGCNLRHSLSKRRDQVSVNGISIDRDLIAREAQNHRAASPLEAWTAAARALVVRELLLQEARNAGIPAVPLTDGDGRRETDDEAMIRGLIEQSISTPIADIETCRRYYESNRKRFRSPDICEVAHILIASKAGNDTAHAEARAFTEALTEELKRNPDRFAEIARLHSACPSGAQGGNLGQITPGQTIAEFEQALSALEPETMTTAPIATRYGYHIIRLDRRIAGRELPFDTVAGRIADYLTENVRRRAIAQYIARLVSRAKITGVELAGATEHRVH